MVHAPIPLLMEAMSAHPEICRLKLGPYRILFASHPEILRHVLQKNHKNYDKRAPVYQKARLVLGNGLLTNDGESWFRQRRIAQPAFHHSRISRFADQITTATDQMLDRWAPHLGTGAPIDVAGEMMALTLRIAGESLLSTDVSDRSSIVGQAITFLAHDVYRRVSSIVDLPPAVPTPANLRFRRHRRALDEIIFEMIQSRRQGTTQAHDLLSMLIEARDEETGHGMSDQQLRDEVLTIFLAGHETSAVTLIWIWYLLSQHPQVEAKLRAELDQVLQGRLPRLEDLDHLAYTQQVIQESMRLYPAGWNLARRAIEDDEIQGYRIPRGSIVLMSPYATHRHPEFWRDPERFDPERFAADVREKIDRFAYLPFGAGPRVCIGSSFAMLSLRLIVATVLQRYRLRLVPGHPIELEPLITLGSRHGMKMTLAGSG